MVISGLWLLIEADAITGKSSVGYCSIAVDIMAFDFAEVGIVLWLVDEDTVKANVVDDDDQTEGFPSKAVVEDPAFVVDDNVVEDPAFIVNDNAAELLIKASVYVEVVGGAKE